MNFTGIEQVNFYNDPIDVALTEEGVAYVSLSQIVGYLGLTNEFMIETFGKDPRVKMYDYGGSMVVPLIKLNGLLMLIPLNSVSEDFQSDLLLYQSECFEVLHDYWIHGLAVNLREVPYNIQSKFKDEREVSRKLLTEACKEFCSNREDLDPSDVFNKVMSTAYKTIGLVPKHENEKLTGVEAQYLAWVEKSFAKVIKKFVMWGESPNDPVDEARDHVKKHLTETGEAWYQMADSMPQSTYR